MFHPTCPCSGRPLTFDELCDPEQIVLRFPDRDFTVADLREMSSLGNCSATLQALDNAARELKAARQRGDPPERLEELGRKEARVRTHHQRLCVVRDAVSVVRAVGVMAASHRPAPRVADPRHRAGAR